MPTLHCHRVCQCGRRSCAAEGQTTSIIISSSSSSSISTGGSNVKCSLHVDCSRRASRHSTRMTRVCRLSSTSRITLSRPIASVAYRRSHRLHGKSSLHSSSQNILVKSAENMPYSLKNSLRKLVSQTHIENIGGGEREQQFLVVSRQ